MPKKRLISSKMMAAVCVIGCGASLAASAGSWAMGGSEAATDVFGQVIATIGVLAWFVGMAAGVLTLSTRYARWGILGLSLGGLTAAAVLWTALL
ncbi:MAG: hypothetical protein KGZ40_08630 [Clostridiales bacterium]|nr:hypothetical protein [Clostridiales bacterium]